VGGGSRRVGSMSRRASTRQDGRRRVPRRGGDGTSRVGLGKRAGDAFTRVRQLHRHESAGGEAMARRRSAAAWRAMSELRLTDELDRG